MIRKEEKKLLKALLDRGAVTEEDLEIYDYLPSEIRDVKDPREDVILYDNMYYDDGKTAIDNAVSRALGEDWKKSYDYQEYKKNDKFGLTIKLTDEEFHRILRARCGAKSKIENLPTPGGDSTPERWAVVSYWEGEHEPSRMHICDTYEEARKLLSELWQKSCDFAREDDNFDKDHTLCEEEYAVVAWYDGLYRHFEIVSDDKADSIV